MPIPHYERPFEDFHVTARNDRQFVVALARGLEILRVFMPGEALLTNGQISERTGLPKATVSRLTHTLTHLGYLVHVAPARAYRLGDAVIGLGHGVLTGLDICRMARGVMEELAQTTGMEVSLSRRDRLSMVVIERVVLPGSRTYCVTVGSRIPIAATATGRVYLSALSDRDRTDFLSLVGERAPEHFEEVQDGLKQAQEDFHKHGFCASFGDWDRNIAGVAAPIFSATGEVETVLAGGLPCRFTNMTRLRREIGPRFAAVAADLSRRLAENPAA